MIEDGAWDGLAVAWDRRFVVKFNGDGGVVTDVLEFEGDRVVVWLGVDVKLEQDPWWGGGVHTVESGKGVVASGVLGGRVGFELLEFVENALPVFGLGGAYSVSLLWSGGGWGVSR